MGRCPFEARATRGALGVARRRARGGPGRPERVLGDDPSRREDDKVDVVRAGRAARRTREHAADRRVGVVVPAPRARARARVRKRRPGGASRQHLRQPQAEGRAQHVQGYFSRGQLSLPGPQGRRCTLRAARGARSASIPRRSMSLLCLRPDPELVKVCRVPLRRRSVESCPSATADELPAACRRPAAAPARESRKTPPRLRHCADGRPGV